MNQVDTTRNNCFLVWPHCTHTSVADDKCVLFLCTLLHVSTYPVVSPVLSDPIDYYKFQGPPPSG